MSRVKIPHLPSDKSPLPPQIKDLASVLRPEHRDGESLRFSDTFGIVPSSVGVTVILGGPLPPGR